MSNINPNSLEELKELLNQDWGSPSSEWSVIKPFLHNNPQLQTTTLKWIFKDSITYWDTRAQAGLHLLKDDNVDVWSILETLVDSDDIDDHGTALTLFELVNDHKGSALAKRLLRDDVNPLSKLEALDYLLRISPVYVLDILPSLELISHQESKIREWAQKIEHETKQAIMNT